jgi:DNA-binding response OmpR family regulator
MAVMKSILIIEDEKDIVNLIEHHLKQSGFSVISALDGPTGLEKARKKTPNLIILDLMLPEMDGKDICRALKSTDTIDPYPHAHCKGRGDRPVDRV